MKRIIYFANGKDEEILITDKEWKEYVPKMESDQNYWCERLETLIPSKIKIANTPQDEVGYEVFLELGDEGQPMYKWLKRNDKWFRNVNYGGEIIKQEFGNEDYMKKKISKMIPQEDYYTNKLYL